MGIDGTTTSMADRYRPHPDWTFIDKHAVAHSAFRDVELSVGSALPNLVITDPPAVDESMSWREYVDWMYGVLVHLDSLIADDAALVIIPNNRKGHPWAKSDLTSFAVASSGCKWELFRKYIWLPYGESDFHRSHYVHISAYVYRRGNMPTNQGSPIRYKDIIRIPDSGSQDRQNLAPFPIKLCQAFISLFDVPQNNLFVMDPFAGSGNVALAAQEWDIPSLSVELDPERAKSIVNKLREGEVKNGH